MTHRFPTLVLALAATLLLAGCHTVKDLVPTTLVPPNLRAPENTDDPLKQAQQRLLDATPCCTSFADFSYQNLLPWQPQPFTLGSGSSVANLAGTHSYFLAFRLPEGAKLPYRVAFKSELNGRWLKSSYLFAPTVVMLDSGFQPIGTSADISLCEHMGWSDAASGAFGSYTVPHGPDGTIWVGMMDNTYAKAVDNAICKKPQEGDGVLNTLRTALPLPWNSNTSSTGTSSTGTSAGGSTTKAKGS